RRRTRPVAANENSLRPIGGGSTALRFAARRKIFIFIINNNDDAAAAATTTTDRESKPKPKRALASGQFCKGEIRRSKDHFPAQRKVNAARIFRQKRTRCRPGDTRE